MEHCRWSYPTQKASVSSSGSCYVTVTQGGEIYSEESSLLFDTLKLKEWKEGVVEFPHSSGYFLSMRKKALLVNTKTRRYGRREHGTDLLSRLSVREGKLVDFTGKNPG